MCVFLRRERGVVKKKEGEEMREGGDGERETERKREREKDK